ncbi:MAG TPA: hypothetical protein VGS08_02415 [Candidatus Saccharimonadales bacterium]|nr:hypothetical protein [Candidatus Saccharimonadales bacterium]
MLGLGRARSDNLPVLVSVLQDRETFRLTGKLWDLNSRNVRVSEANHKEFLRFGLMEAKEAVWLERDQGRTDAFELILTWVEGDIRYFDVYAVVPGSGGVGSGDTAYAKQLLEALLTTPATLPVDKPK